jgi:predicted Rossmann fold nucleotide-binding protein DprA/Smf involved in DNA uptake
MTTEKTTYRSAVEYAIAHLTDAPADVQEKLSALLESLSKKATAERKPTAKQTANETYKQNILDFMERGTLYSVQDVFKGVEAWANDADMTPARVSALLTQLKKAELIVREEDHRKAYFRLA